MFQEINSIKLQDNDVELDCFSAEQCHENSELTAELSASPTITLASMSAGPPQRAPEPSKSNAPPQDFYSAIEAQKMQGEDWDMRPHIHDKLSGNHILLDSGAQVSAYPPDPGDSVDSSVTLKAVNGARLKCYGYKDVKIKINRKTYDIRAIKTDVPNPILGWDFQRKHRLTVDWTDFGDAEIIDKKNGIKSILKYKAVSLTSPRRLAKLEVAPVSRSPDQIVFEVSSMAALAEETEEIISDLKSMPDSEYKTLLT